ncbi:MAG: MerR family transcriptional regulator [Gammaproteobacteria bacterium]|nr:MerR family transcriptional regulator [Gammaproteobacteria bacterium]
MKIGALAKQTQVSVETIRYYEQRQLLNPPARSKAGYRDYSPDDLQRLRFIVQAKTLGVHLAGDQGAAGFALRSR